MATYITGKYDYNVICDVCGFQYKAHEVKKRWDGKIVCQEDWEQRHPSDFYRVRQDQHRLPFTRPDIPSTTTAYDVDVGGYAIDCKKTQNATVASPSITNLVANFPLTIEAMVLMPNASITSTQNIYRYAGGGYIFRVNATDQLDLYFFNSTNSTGYAVTAPGFLVSGLRGRWTRLAISITSAGVAAATYVYRDGNGVLQTNSTALVPGIQGGLGFTGSLIIGNTTGINEPAPGPIDDIRVWNTTRSAAEILDKWEKVMPPTTTGLVSNWRFDDLTTNPPASTTTDSIIAQTATLNGAGSFPHMMKQGT